jgi:hypothetical protein
MILADIKLVPLSLLFAFLKKAAHTTDLFIKNNDIKVWIPDTDGLERYATSLKRPDSD